LQAELRRVGCNSGTVDGNWSPASQKALELFNQHAGLKLDVKAASVDALDAVKARTGRICPLICETGFRMARNASRSPAAKATSRTTRGPARRSR
jgi:Putative peptidoglycan binding domain